VEVAKRRDRSSIFIATVSTANLILYKEVFMCSQLIALTDSNYSRADALGVTLKLTRGSLKSALCLLVVLTFGFTISAVVSAQTSTGSITGIVSDPSGAVIPGVQVAVKNMATGNSFKVTTNRDGVFNVGSLPPGQYTLSASQSGFRPYVVSGINLDPGQVVNQNITLQVSSQTQTVSVSAQAIVVNTANGTTGGTITNEQIARIDVNGRNYQALASLIPGINNTSAGKQLSGLGLNNGIVISSNGLGTNKNLIMVDGSFNMNFGCECAGDANPEMDTISEVQVLTSDYSAKYGYTGGAQILVETKSGGSRFHGEANDFVRNDAFDARNFFTPKVPKLNQNIFGYDIGGPVYIPGKYNTQKNKTFFFWAQHWRLIANGLTLPAAVPTAAMRQGNFSGFTIKDPLTGQPFPNSQIPQSRMDPNALLLMNQIIPLPNNPLGGFNNFLNDNTDHVKQRQEVIRLDHNFSDRERVMARYIQEDVYDHNPQSTFSGSVLPTIGTELDTFNKNFYFQITSVPSPSAVNNIAFSFTQTIVNTTPFGAADIPPGYTGKLVFPAANNLNRVPNLTFAGGYTNAGVGGVDSTHDAPDRALTWTDDFSKVAGTHTLQAGIFVNRGMAGQLLNTTPQGQYLFTGQFTGNPIADFLLGKAATFTQGSNEPRGDLLYFQVEPYFEDDWKVTRRFTLNLGVRYSYQPPWYLKEATTSFVPRFYDPARAPEVTLNGVLVPTPNYDPMNGLKFSGDHSSEVPVGFSKTQGNLWEPRFGFAWDVFGDGKTAIRGGFGMTYYRTEDQVWGTLQNPPGVTFIDLINVPFSNPIAGEAAPVLPPNLSVTPYNAIPTRISSYSLGVQRQLGVNTLLSVYYAGNSVLNMDFTRDINQPLPVSGYQFDPRLNANTISANAIRPYLGYGSMTTRFTDGTANYNSLQVGLSRRYMRNLSFQAAYTYSKTLGKGNDIFGKAQNAYDLDAEYGTSKIDRTHILNVGYVYDLPFFQGRSGWAGRLLGGWGVSGITTYASGFALTPGMATSNAGLATRPNATGQALFPAGSHTVGEWFSSAAFAAPAPGFFGNAAIGSIRGPGLGTWDVALTKQTHLYQEKVNSELRLGIFNVFNHTNFSGVSTAFGAGNFGQVTSTLDPRIMELALRIWF
jgi:hypothetical protein